MDVKDYKEELIEKIMQKKEFSQLPRKDVERAFEKFDKRNLNEYQKMKMTRGFLREIFSSFSSRKLLNPDTDKSAEWILKKHKSTKERFEYYEELYRRIFKNMKEFSIIDLGAGVNGISYVFFNRVGLKPKYVAVEAIGQLNDLVNKFFHKNKIDGKAFRFSLFETEKIIRIMKKQSKPRVVFMFKVIDSIESVKRDFSKEFIEKISEQCEKIVLSFATKSLGSRKKFAVNRNWILKFIEDKFEIIDDFEFPGERYIVFKKK